MIVFEGNSNIVFANNHAKINGGALILDDSSLTLNEASLIQFKNNHAEVGGALWSGLEFTFIISGNSVVTFSDNSAIKQGGAIAIQNHGKFASMGNTSVLFVNNSAMIGGALYMETINVTIEENSTVTFNDSNAEGSGGEIIFKRKLELYKPAECIDNSSVGYDSYYVENIMLGQEFLIQASMYDYYDQPTGTEEFLVNSADGQDYYIPGSQYVLISCNHTFQDIRIIGNETTPVLPFNYSMTIISLYVCSSYF